MYRQPPISYLDPAKVVTLEIDVPTDELPPLDVVPVQPPEAAQKVLAQRVLLLEDRDDFRQVLCDHLVYRGFEVTSVPSGIEGLGEIKKGAFDIILCDMLMPRSGGEMFYWAVTRLRPATAQRFIFLPGTKTTRRSNFSSSG